MKMTTNKFIKTYLNILYESNGNLKFDLQKYICFLTSAIKFDNFENIINEEKEDLIDIPIELIHYLLKHLNEEINGDDFKQYFKQSKHWSNLKNIKFDNIFFSIFDFSNNNEIDKFHINCFNIHNDDLKIIRNEFIQYVQLTVGFFNKYDNLNIICVNNKNNNIFQTIYHELSHFVQIIGNVRIVNGINETDIKNKNILNNIFNVDYDLVLSYFSNTEFVPHIDDLYKMLLNTKNKCYKDISNLDFIEQLRNFLQVKTRREMLNNQFLINFKNSNYNNYDSLSMLLFSYISGYKFQQIFNILKRRFGL